MVLCNDVRRAVKGKLFVVNVVKLGRNKMGTANAVVNWVGPMNVFLGLYVFAILLIAVGAVWAAYKAAKAIADAQNEAQALVGADATPSVKLLAEDKFRQIESLGCLCPAGTADRIVEDFFHDQECVHPCGGHPGCQLAH